MDFLDRTLLVIIAIISLTSRHVSFSVENKVDKINQAIDEVIGRLDNE
jgi:hypothetical protein